MKKIFILSPAHPLRGGIASSTERLAQELMRAGVEVTIYSFSLQYPSFLFPGKTQYTDDPAPPGLDIRTCINAVNPFNWLRIGRQIARARPDLVLSRFWLPFLAPSLGTIMRLARRNGHTRTIALVDNLVPHEQRPGDRPLTRYFTDCVEGFIVMSKTVKVDIRRFSPDKPISFIPHPVYDNYGQPVSREEGLAQLALPAGPRYLLFFGFIRDYKGLDLLLRAAADPRIRTLDLRFIVAGEFYGNEEKYRRLIDELGIGPQLILRNEYIPLEEVKYYFAAADLIVQPYKSATQSGISQLAYHFERPMLVTEVGGLPEIIEHNKEGYVVPVDVDAIVRGILDFFENDRLPAMRARVCERKKDFSWENMVAGIRDLYRELNARSR